MKYNQNATNTKYTRNGAMYFRHAPGANALQNRVTFNNCPFGN
jgi:hypothetical protein